MSRVRPIARLATSLALLAAAADVRAASFIDPVYRFRTLTTAHFSIHFHQGEDRLAGRLAVIAEDVWRRLARPLGSTPPRHTHVVLVDQTENANGFATPVPYNTILVTAAWPRASEFVGKTEDWLRLVFTHEFTHIVHLDRSVGWAKYVRGVFGRMPLAFPNLFLPRWHVEGLATYEESQLTGAGRLHAGDFRAVATEAARAGKVEPLDRVNGGLTDWPGGLGAYVYGVGFHEYLAQRFGEASFARLADATARRAPFVASRAFREVYGESLGDLWRAYQASVVSGLTAPAPDEARRLTRHGFSVTGPRFDTSVCAGCPSRVVYSVRTPHDFPALYELVDDGSPPKPVATRYLGSTSAVTADRIYFDQQELRRSTGLYSDLYRLERATGEVARLTTEARILDPDLSPDGRTLVAVQDRPGQRDLVLVDVGSAFRQTNVESAFRRTILVAEPETQFNAPRWSPDGRTIAVERHAPGGESEIVAVDVADGRVRVIAAQAGVRFVTPAWRPDGRGVVAAADFGDGPFNLYEAPLDGPRRLRQLTRTAGGATWPDVSPDGTRIVFVGYTADGFDLFEMPYPREQTGVTIAADPYVRATTGAADLAPTFRLARYNPLQTLRPTSWTPTMEGDRHTLRLGFATSGVDVLGYHAYSASANWQAIAPAGGITPNRAAPDWQAYYQYDRWRPTLWASASTNTSFFAGPPSDDGTPATATLREREIEGGIALPFRRIRVSHVALMSFVGGANEFTRRDGVTTSHRAAWRAAWSLSSSRRYGYSISQEDGVAIGVTSEIAREALGSSADASAATADARIYVSPFAQHQVLALRLAGGWSTGDPTVRRAFHLGGSQPNTDTLSFGRQAISLLRGFQSDTFAGSRVALFNTEYRWPLAHPQRGFGTWPFFLRAAHAAVFTDVGHAWTRAFSASDLKASAGAEASFDMTVAYAFPLTVTIGAARARDGSQTVPGRGALYVRVGHAF